MNNVLLKSSVFYKRIWLLIVKTRLFFCILIILSAFLFKGLSRFTPETTVIVTLVYFLASAILIGFFNKNKLSLERFRVLRDLGDVAFVTYFIIAPTYPTNLWFLLYIFPMASTARFGGRKLIITLSMIIILTNIILYLYALPSDLDNNFNELLIRCLFLFAISISLENLSRARKVEQKGFNNIFKEIIENYINESNLKPDKQLYLSILKNALDLTNSQMGHIRLVDVTTGTSEVIASIGHPIDYNWALRPMADSFSKIAVRTKKHYYINWITDKLMKQKLSYYFTVHKPIPRSAVFCPVIRDNTVIAVIAVYSKRRHHYSKEDIKNLDYFSSLVAIIKDIANVYDSRKKQIETLEEIGNLIIYQEELKDTFDKITFLTLEKLCCEESAIFLLDSTSKDILVKESDRIFAKTDDKLFLDEFFSKEKTYRIGDFAVGKCYERQEVISSVNEKHLLSQEKNKLKAYSQLLPSRHIENFICAPILRGETKIGVIRVLNKKVSLKSQELSKEGFNDEDKSLLKVIASQLAVVKLLKDYEETLVYFEGLVQNSPDPIIVLNSSGKITKFNAACEKIWGYKAEEVMKKSVHRYYESYEHAKEIGEQLKLEHTITRIARIKNKRKNIIPINLSASLLMDKNGHSLGSIGVFKDLREQWKMEATEKQAEIGKLMQIFGHDIKNQLGIAQNFIKSVKIDPNYQNSAKLRNFALNAVEISANKIRDILNAVKLRETKLKSISLSGLFKNYAFVREKEGFITQATERNYEFEDHLVLDEKHRILIDLEQMNQVFLNLFFNSIAAIDERKENNESDFVGRIKMSACVNSEQLIIKWEDNGSGIPEDKITEIFYPFITTKKFGNGLGLFSVKTIIERHKGTIEAESVVGQRTIFSISLPLNK